MELAMTPLSSGHTPRRWDRTPYAQLTGRLDQRDRAFTGDTSPDAARVSLAESIEQALLEDERLHGD
jgi:hypothetical protein